MLAIEVKLSARDDARRGDAGLFRSRRGGERRRSQEDAWCTEGDGTDIVPADQMVESEYSTL